MNGILQDNVRRRDRIRGSLIGGAAGDALGYAVEFWSEDDIFSHYGPEGIREYEPDPYSGKAQISDDTQMTLFTANGLLYGETRSRLRGMPGQPTAYVPAAYLDWLRTQQVSYPDAAGNRGPGDGICWLLDVPELYSRRAPGNTCLSALYSMARGGECGDIDTPLNRSKGCGGVMRAAPMGLMFYPGTEIETIDREGARLAAVTHGHSLGYMPAAVLTHIVNRIVYGPETMTLEAIAAEARDAAAALFAGDPYVGTLTALLDLAMALAANSETDLENIHRLGEGWVGEEAIAVAVYCALRHQDDFSAGIVSAVNHRGDSDSTGTIAGNSLGAWIGSGRIDDKWKRDLELCDVILEMADDLCRGCQTDAGGAIADPDWARKYVR